MIVSVSDGITPRITWPYSSNDLLYNAIKSADPSSTDLLMLGTYTNVNELIQDDPTIYWRTSE